MIGSLIKKIVGSKNERELRRIQPLVDKINQTEPKVSPLSDDQLRAKTSEFKNRIERGESIEEILPQPLLWSVKQRNGPWVKGITMSS